MEQAKKEHTILFGKLMRRHDYLLHKICHKYGIYRGQHHILMALEIAPGLSQNELAAKIDVAKASITTSLNRMERHGFVIRKKSEEDGRRNLIYITDKGLAASHGCSEEIEQLKEALFSQIDQQELAQVNEILSKLLAGLNTLD